MMSQTKITPEERTSMAPGRARNEAMRVAALAPDDTVACSALERLETLQKQDALIARPLGEGEGSMRYGPCGRADHHPSTRG